MYCESVRCHTHVWHRSRSLLAQEPYELDVDIYSPDGLDQIVKVKLPVILPHELFAALSDKGGDVWVKHVWAPDACQEWWTQSAATDYMQGHTVLADPSQWKYTVPLGLHGDAAKFTKLDSLFTLSWNNVAAPKGVSAFDTRFLITAIPTPWLIKGVTVNQVLVAVAWSMAVLRDGVHPDRDHQFERWPLHSQRQRMALTSLSAFGAKASVVDYRGDWEHQTSFWSVQNWNNLDGMCFACRASWRGNLVYTNFGSTAPWQTQPRTTAEFMAANPPGIRNPLADLVDWRLEFIRFDETHANKLGISRWSIASSLLCLSDRLVFGDGPLEQRLGVAWSQFKRWLLRHGLQCNARRFTKARLGLGAIQYCESSTKAWNSRIVISWLADVAIAAPLAAEADSVLATHLHALSTVFQTMERAGNFFSDAELKEFVDNGMLVLATNAWLSAWALRERSLRWCLRPKHHAFQHLILLAQRDKRNPKRYATILDEDFIGRVVRVARVCHRRTMAEGVLFRYLVRLRRRWCGLDSGKRRRQPQSHRRRILRFPPARL